MARKAGQGKEEEGSRARQQKEKTPVRDEEKTPACHGGGHHVVEQEIPIVLREEKMALGGRGIVVPAEDSDSQSSTPVLVF
ncbi:hypothetical protein STEG23_002983 [Scotinomys teguina]